MAGEEVPLHEQQCFACWLRALDVDLTLASSLIASAYRLGWAMATTTLLPSTLNKIIAPSPPTLSDRAYLHIADEVRAAVAMPASPDVAQAMGGHHG